VKEMTMTVLEAAEKATDPPKIEPKAKVFGPIKSSRLHFGRLKQTSAAHKDHFADIPAGVDFKTALQPSFWAHHVRDLRPLDTIEMFCEDGSWEALCRVMYVGEAEANLKKVYYVEHGATEEVSASEAYEVKWKGPGAQFCVVRKEDGKVIQDKLYPKDKAQAYLANYLKSMRV
ncbi:hypothetical protein LCGC14_1766540, partial [marine sediment metagenome]